MIFRSQYGQHSAYLHDVARVLERDPRPERRAEARHVRKLADQLHEYAEEDEEFRPNTLKALEVAG